MFDREIRDLKELAAIVQQPYTRSRRYEFRLITGAQYSILHSDIVASAAELGLKATYTLQWFKDYAYRNGGPKKQTRSLPCHCRNDKPSQYKHAFSQSKLGFHLVAVGLCIERTAPNEETSLFIATAIAKFNKEHWKERPSTRIERELWVDDDASIALSEQVRKVAKAREKRGAAWFLIVEKVK